MYILYFHVWSVQLSAHRDALIEEINDKNFKSTRFDFYHK